CATSLSAPSRQRAGRTARWTRIPVSGHAGTQSMLPRLERRCFRFRPVAAPGAVSAVVPCPCPPLPGALSSAAAPDPALEARLFPADGATAALEERQSAGMIGRRSLVEEVRGQAALLRRPRDDAPPGPRGRRREVGGDARLQRREDGEGAR